jgi:cytochrome P450
MDAVQELPELDQDVALFAMSHPVDPQGAYVELQTRCPMGRTASGVSILKMSDLVEINRHPDILGAGGATAPRGTLGAERPLIPLDIDGEDHRKYRRLLDPLFAPKRVELLVPVVRQRTNELIDEFVDAGRTDAYASFCEPLPSSIFVDLMGVPRADVAQFQSFKDAVIRPQGGTMEEMMDYARQAGKQTYEYFDSLLNRREASEQHPQDLLAELSAAEVDGQRLTRLQLLDITYLLMIAGLDTVVSSLSCLLAWLAEHPDERRWIIEDPARWPGAIEELMRFQSPVMYGSRMAAADVEVCGRSFPAGTMFNVSWSSANVDPDEFEEPLTVKLDRTPNRHAGFATGFHRCLGSSLARMEMRVALDEFHKRIPDYAIDSEGGLEWTALGVRAASRLPLRWS